MHPDFESMTVGGLELRYLCSGEGTPTVVLDQGHGISVEESLTRPGTIGWAHVVQEVSKNTRIFVHDRAVRCLMAVVSVAGFEGQCPCPDLVET